jgi:hypothetical protein
MIVTVPGPRLDLLQQAAVAVRIAERRERAVVGTVRRRSLLGHVGQQAQDRQADQ